MSELAKKWVRHSIQAVATLLQNANFKGFLEGKIYQGPSKSVCVPGLNCYSCPGAIGACPIGSLQSYLSGLKFKVPYYVAGILIFVGALIGRAVCGFLCPFGFLQDLIYKIPFFKKNEFKIDKYLRWFKYAVLVLFVLMLPFCFKLTPFFCKYICPSGTIAGIWLASANKQIADQLGGIFSLKLVILGLILTGSLIIYRPFCKYIGPLGAIYGFFNRIALYRLHLDKDKCVGCKACAKACKMNVDPSISPDSCECIRCGECVNACPHKALRMGVKTSKAEKQCPATEKDAV